MYRVSLADGPLRQGEILSNVVQYVYDPVEDVTQGILHDYAILGAQDCDLERAHEALGTDAEPLNGALLFPCSPVPEGRANAGINSKIWAHTKINANERYQVLQRVPENLDLQGAGVPDLLIDFRNYFTLSYAQISHQLQHEELRRHASLEPPYREHFQSRAMSYLARIALDPVHEIGQDEPGGTTETLTPTPAGLAADLSGSDASG